MCFIYLMNVVRINSVLVMFWLMSVDQMGQQCSRCDCTLEYNNNVESLFLTNVQHDKFYGSETVNHVNPSIQRFSQPQKNKNLS